MYSRRPGDHRRRSSGSCPHRGRSGRRRSGGRRRSPARAARGLRPGGTGRGRGTGGAPASATSAMRRRRARLPIVGRGEARSRRRPRSCRCDRWRSRSTRSSRSLRPAGGPPRRFDGRHAPIVDAWDRAGRGCRDTPGTRWWRRSACRGFPLRCRSIRSSRARSCERRSPEPRGPPSATRAVPRRSPRDSGRTAERP